MLQPQKCTFWEKSAENIKNITILHFMITFHNFACNIETD